MPYIRQVGDRFKVEIRVTMRNGEVVKENPYFDTKAEAESYGKERERALRQQIAGGFPSTTVRELIEKWRDEVAPSRDGRRWDINRCNQILKLFAEYTFDSMELEEFGPPEMAVIRERRLKEVKPASVKREECLIGAIWAAARHPTWNLTNVDPLANLGPIKRSKSKARKRRAQWQELRLILRELGYHPRQPERNKTAQVGLAMLVSLRTTLRAQEVLQLGNQWVDLNRLVITIPQHKTLYLTDEPKCVPIMPKALLLFARKGLLGRDQYFTVANATRDTMFRRARARAGITGLTFHDLKRTGVSLVKDLMDEKQLMSVTGNKDVEVLREHYMLDEAAVAAVKVWRELGVDRQKVFSAVGLSAS